jgi:hypothetical protein
VFDVSEQQGRREVSDRQELIRRFAVAIAGRYQAADFRWCRVSSEDIWKVAKSLADAEPQQPEPQPEHTREDWWELQGDVTRLTQDVQRLSGTVETLEGRIRRAAALLRGATRLDTKAGFMVSENKVDEAIQILEDGSDD